MNCAVCGQPMKLIPAGKSKTTGKAYSAFYACQDRTHKQPRPGFPPQVVAQVAKQPETNWDKISWGKCKYGFMIEQMKKGVDVFIAEQEAERWADAAMRKSGKPEITSVHGQPQVNQNPFDDDIRVEDIPM